MDWRIVVILALRDEAVTIHSHWFSQDTAWTTGAGVHVSSDHLEHGTDLDCSIAFLAS